jgi:dipeptidyl aminopeptidase/acylaminoacyl peptidase
MLPAYRRVTAQSVVVLNMLADRGLVRCDCRAFSLIISTNGSEELSKMVKHTIIAIFLLLIICPTVCCRSANGLDNRVKIEYLSHPDNTKKRIEFFLMKPDGDGPWPAIVYIHGHQIGQRNGGKDFVTWGILEDATKRGFVAVAVSQPGYGGSDGPPDFCGSFTQDAVEAVITWLREKPFIKFDKIGLLGISRGAIVASIIATKDQQLGAMVLISGLYDFPKKIKNSSWEDVKNEFFLEAGESIKAQEERSVLYFADKIRTPTLIMNGEKDDRTDPEQAKLLSQKIQNNGIYSKVIIYPEYGHQIPFEIRNKEVIPFFDQYLLKL